MCTVAIALARATGGRSRPPLCCVTAAGVGFVATWGREQVAGELVARKLIARKLIARKLIARKLIARGRNLEYRSS